MRVKMVPESRGELNNGIARVVAEYHRHLPKFGVELVSGEDYDLLAAHAGSTGSKCDVAHCHGLYWTADYDAPDWEYKTNVDVVASLRNALQITVPSQWVAQVIRRDMRINPHVIPHGVEWEEWQGIGDRGDYVLYNKNRQGDVCDSSPVAFLAEHAPDRNFVSTFSTAALPNIKITGAVPHKEMRKLVANAGVYLATTKETFGIGILEAMAAGIPVLGYAHGGIVDMVCHGVNGYLVPPGDLEGLLEGLEYCLRYGKTLGENGREIARGYSWEGVCQRVAEVYQEALKPDPPEVSVVIPTYNYGHVVGRAIDSVLAQTFPVKEVVVVDDGSTDGIDLSSWEEKDPRIKVIKQRNQGVAVARNAGIAATTSKYVGCLDADDFWGPTFVEKLVPHLEKDRSLGIAYSGLMLHGKDWESPGDWPKDSNYDLQLKGQNQVPTSCLFRKSAWERLGGYRQRYAPLGCGTEDAEFWLRIGSIGFSAKKVTEESLFHYTLGGRTNGKKEYTETNWLEWHPWHRSGLPFASVATPQNRSHPVRQYGSPVVSVVIPVGPGHEHHVIEALDSVEAQTMTAWECIVVWDAGKEVPAWLLKAYPYVSWNVTSDGPSGAGRARNVGADLAKAPFLLFLDADDWLLPDALETMLLAYSETESIIYCDSFGIRAVDDKVAGEYQRHGELVSYRGGVATVRQPVAEYDYSLAIRQPYSDPPYFWCYISSLVPKSWHEEISGFDEGMESWEDWDYWIRMAKAGKPFCAVRQPLIVYCYDTGQRRESGKAMKESLRNQMIEKHKELTIMACSGGCGKRAHTINSPLPTVNKLDEERSTSAMQDTDFVMIEYHPTRGGSHGVVGLASFPTKAHNNMLRGRGGWVFNYGYRSKGDVFLVHVQDQKLAPEWFRRYSSPEAQRVIRLPVETKAPAPTPVPVAIAPKKTETPQEILPPEAPQEEQKEVKRPPFDLQTLPGVTPALAEEMRKLGLTTPEAVLAFDLTVIKGIGDAKAAAIKDSLKVAPDVPSILEEVRMALEKAGVEPPAEK